MDRRYAYRLLIAGCALATTAVAAERAADLPMAEARWIADGHDPVRSLTQEPGECLVLPADPARRRSVEIGRAAFRDPLLLGGVAARVGLACASCHREGHDNPDFHFPGLSGAPGTADTTSAVTSEVRDDGRFDPKPIPSLVTGERTPTVSRANDGALERFIHSLIVDEFDGAEPPRAVLSGLASYVRSLRTEACGQPTRLITAASRLEDAQRALAAGSMAAADGDRETASVMVASARAMLGGIADRLPPPAPPQTRLEVAKLGAELGRIPKPISPAQLSDLQDRLSALARGSGRWERQSLYDPVRVAAALRGR